MNSINQHTILLLPTCKSIEAIDIHSIIRIEAISNYSKLFFVNGKTLVVAKALAWFQKKLPCQPFQQEDNCFIRIHRTHLINKNFIHQYIRDGQGKVKLHNGELIDISKRKKSYFLQCWYAAA
jgi:two-component system, LytTR family, response regulator